MSNAPSNSASLPLSQKTGTLAGLNHGMYPANCVGVIIGHASEFFDYFVYAIASFCFSQTGFFLYRCSDRNALFIRHFFACFCRPALGHINLYGY